MFGVKLEDFRIPFDEIKLGSDNFSAENFIGGGGFGKVFRGKLLESRNHGEVAIKRLDAKSLQGKHEFLNEISLLFSYRHENIISFIGYCDEANEMIVVYEYAINQSLDKYLYDTNKMSTISWEQRLRICIGAAKGLNYLHWGLGEHHRVIHRDIKSANILLDENWVAKISDFGLSKIGPKDLPYTHLHTKVAGTLGYCDPNYYGTDVLRKESDVYSFGVVLFEMLSGRLVYKKRCKEDDDEQESLVEWVRCCYKDGLEKIIDPHIKDQIKSKSLDVFKEIAYRCLKIKVSKRPTMAMVVQKLEEALDCQINNHQRDSASTSGSGETLVEHEEEEKERENNMVDHPGNQEKESKRLAFITGIKKSLFFWKKKEQENNKLVFLKETGRRFDLQDLLTASAMLVGKGVIGTTYLAKLDDTTSVIVKRLRYREQFSKNQFVKHLEAIADQKHPNLLPPLAYYYSKDENLLVYKFVANGNLFNRLHEKRTEDRVPFQWSSRLSVAVGVAQAMEYLHSKSRLQVPHGNLKSSNVLLDENEVVLVTEYGFTSFIPNTVADQRIVSFKSPEYVAEEKVSKKSDVWCYGVLLLELLTGRISIHSASEIEQEALDLYAWVDRVIQEERTVQIFDLEITKQRNSRKGRQKLLEIAMRCCDRLPEKRPDMIEVAQEVENINMTRFLGGFN